MPRLTSASGSRKRIQDVDSKKNVLCHSYKKTPLAKVIACIFISASLSAESYAVDLSIGCSALGGVVDNGVCKFLGTNSQSINSSINVDSVDFTVEGGNAEKQYGIGTFMTETGKTLEIRNRNGRRIYIKGGTGKGAHGLNQLASQGGTLNVLNEDGEIVIQGSANACGIQNFYSENTREDNQFTFDLKNKSKISILGSDQPGEFGQGIYNFSAITYHKYSITNDEGALFLLKGGADDTCGVHHIGWINSFVNKGTLIFEGGFGKQSAGVKTGEAVSIDNVGIIEFRGGVGESSYGMELGSSWNDGHINIQNKGTVKITGGKGVNSAGINRLAAYRGNIRIDNDNELIVQGGDVEGSVGINIMSDGMSIIMTPNVVFNNNKNFKILGGTTPTSHAIVKASNSRGKITINNNADGVLSILGGTNGAFGIKDSYNLIINNFGTIILDEMGIGAFNGKLKNKETGTVITPVHALFEGEVNDVSTGAPKEIFFIHDGKVAHTSTDLFKGDSVATQQGHLTLKEDWKKASWDRGGTVVFTDIVDGTELAESIRSQFDDAFNRDFFTGEIIEGTKIKFSGTGSGPHGDSSSFDMTVVKALIDEGKLASGDVVTSEALTHKDKTFTLGQTGDMTQDTGFMGIHGSKGITVKDGKTLTLMGSQATMAMAVGADTRDAAFVVTDAPLTLENGTLNLGHQALSATEGRLASVTFDDQSSLNVNHGIFSLATLQGEGALTLREGSRATIEGELTGGSLTNEGTLTVLGKATLKSPGISSSGFRATPEGVFINEKGGTLNFNGGVDVKDFAVLGNREGATINAGHVRVDPMGVIENLEGGTLNYASLEAYGIIRQNGVMNVTGNFTVSDDYETTLEGETKAGVLTVGRQSMQLFRRAGSEAFVRNTGKTYADELNLVSGRILVTKDGILAGRTLRDGAVGSDITVEVGGTFGFSHNKNSLENTLKQYTGPKEKKAILALNTDLHFAKGGSLTVGTVHDDKGTVNLGSDALLLLGTTELHGEALFNGESRQHLHAEEGAVIAMTDNLLWGNHYLMKGFDKASTDDIMKVGVKDKDGHALTTKSNEHGIYVTVGSDNIREKDRDYRLINQMNWLLDGHQDLSAKAPDVAFLTAALVDPQGARATNRVEALAMDAGVLAETKRMGDDIQGLMLDHAGAGRVGYGTFWADGLFAKTKSGDFKRASGTSAYDSETTGFAFGLDLPITNVDWRVGAAFSAQRGDLDGQVGLSSDIEGYGFSVYGGRMFDSGLSVTTALSYLTTSHDIAAHNLGTVKADVDANVWVFGGRVAMPFAYKQVWMTPYLGAEVMKLKEGGFTSSWQHQAAFRYDDVDATLIRTPLGVKAGTFMPLEWLGHSGTLNWDIDVALVPQFGDKEADYRVSGVTNGHSDGVKGGFANDWLTTAKLGMSWQGASGAFGIYYGAELGDVRELSHTVRAKASIYF